MFGNVAPRAYFWKSSSEASPPPPPECRYVIPTSLLGRQDAEKQTTFTLLFDKMLAMCRDKRNVRYLRDNAHSCPR